MRDRDENLCLVVAGVRQFAGMGGEEPGPLKDSFQIFDVNALTGVHLLGQSPSFLLLVQQIPTSVHVVAGERIRALIDVDGRDSRRNILCESYLSE